VGGRDVGGAVVGHQSLHLDPVGAVEADRPPQEADRGGRLLVGQDLDVGQAGGVVDADVDPLPAGHAPAVTTTTLELAPAVAGDPMPRPLDADPAQFLDVDVDQLAGSGALVAADRLRRLEAREPAETYPLQHRRDGRGRHPQGLGDLRPGQSDPPQRGDRLDPLGRGGVGDPPGRRAPVEQPGLALGAVAADPLAGGPLAHSGGLGRLRERPALLDDTSADHEPALRAELGISVKLHPGLLLGAGA
jgi:hypothetical protein